MFPNFCVLIMGSDIKGAKSNVAINAWLQQANYHRLFKHIQLLDLRFQNKTQHIHTQLCNLQISWNEDMHCKINNQHVNTFSATRINNQWTKAALDTAAKSSVLVAETNVRIVNSALSIANFVLHNSSCFFHDFFTVLIRRVSSAMPKIGSAGLQSKPQGMTFIDHGSKFISKSCHLRRKAMHAHAMNVWANHGGDARGSCTKSFWCCVQFASAAHWVFERWIDWQNSKPIAIVWPNAWQNQTANEKTYLFWQNKIHSVNCHKVGQNGHCIEHTTIMKKSHLPHVMAPTNTSVLRPPQITQHKQRVENPNKIDNARTPKCCWKTSPVKKNKWTSIETNASCALCIATTIC